MLEGLIAGLVLAVLGGASLAYAILPWEVAFGLGAALVAIGLAEGIPTGFAYHVLLYRRLHRRGALSPRWWLNPLAEHHRLRPEERPAVLALCYAGGAGFLIAMGGCLLLVIGALHSG